MTTYTNEEGFVLGTDGPDRFVYTRFMSENVMISAGDGIDEVEIDTGSTSSLEVYVEDWNGAGEFSGSVAGWYDGQISYYEVEDVTIAGSSAADQFTLQIGPDTTGLAVDFDAGGGHDTLVLHFQNVTEDFTFRFVSDTVTSTFGTFFDFERFVIYGGSGNDTIRTGAGADEVFTAAPSTWAQATTIGAGTSARTPRV